MPAFELLDAQSTATDQFLTAVADDELHVAWLLAATSGMRRGEVLGLRWHDTDEQSDRAAIHQQLTTVDNQALFQPPKTAKGRRSVALAPHATRALRDHRTAQLKHRLLVGEAWPHHDLVFTRADGKYVHPDYFSGRFRYLTRRTGLPAIRLHDLRHGWATMALEAGIHPKVVSEQLGQATTAITLDIYSHVSPIMSADAVNQVAEKVLGSLPQHES